MKVPVICDLCERSFKHKDYLNVHMAKEHLNVKHFLPLSFCCDCCGKKYNHKKNLVHHLNLYHMEEKISEYFVCDKCGRRRFRKENLYIHTRSHVCIMRDVLLYSISRLSD